MPVVTVSDMIYRPIFYAGLLAVLFVPQVLRGQSAETYASVSRPQAVALPGNDAVLSLTGDNLFVYSAGLMLRADRRQGEVLGLVGDVSMNGLDKRIDYAVCHPVTGNLFYTTLDKRGRTSLYELVPREGKAPKARRVKIGRIRHGVTHPVFSADGRLMVFAARLQTGAGMDLWYSVLTEKGWSAPVNMGRHVNTFGDETSPFISGNHLFFASRGRDSLDLSTWRLYATQLLTASGADTAAPARVAEAEVQRLPDGVNSGHGDNELVVDTVQRRVYWVSQRDGEPALYSFAGTPEGFLLSGRVTDTSHAPMRGVRVDVWCEGRRLASLVTDVQGRYSLPLQAGKPYELRYSYEACFTATELINERHRHGELLQPLRRDVVLHGWSLDTPLHLYNPFGDNADVTLTADAGRQLESMRRFLHDNPGLHVTFVLHCSRTTDAYVNSMINERRLEVLRRFFADTPAAAHYVNNVDDSFAPSGAGNLSDWLEVTFRKK
ncbi:MAG: hypothetical protein AUK63_408 [bacterium P3]|nr:MAG: hypothetical protein AUK63_408 [bacterium P3]KWW42632.1 MAG: hypothetical protein F083_36 [bacterium F083]